MWNIMKYCIFCRNVAKIDLKKILFSLRSKKGQKWLINFINVKLFQKGQMATLIYVYFVRESEGEKKRVSEREKERERSAIAKRKREKSGVEVRESE